MANKWHYFDMQPQFLKTHGVFYPKAFKYAKAMEEGAMFPPVKVCLFKGRWVVQNGAHRVMACRMLGKPVKVRSKVLKKALDSRRKRR